jgi:hypothetical protein
MMVEVDKFLSECYSYFTMYRTEKDLDGNHWSLIARPLKVAGGDITGYMVTALVNGKPFLNPLTCKGKDGIHTAIAELLRWADKLGYNFPMASASRERSYMKHS